MNSMCAEIESPCRAKNVILSVHSLHQVLDNEGYFPLAAYPLLPHLSCLARDQLLLPSQLCYREFTPMHNRMCYSNTLVV